MELKPLSPQNLSLNTSWLTGFIERDGNFNTQIRSHTVGIRISITQKEKEILNLINNEFLESISYSTNPNPHYKYSAGSVQTRNLWINYFSKFPLKTSKNIQYLRWLKCHNIVINGLHKTEQGIAQIKKILNKDEDIVRSS